MRAPGRVEQPDQRDPLGQRQLAQARDLELSGHAHRARHHGEVVGGDRDQAAVDLAVAGDDPVGRGVAAGHGALREVRLRVDPELDPRAVVDQQREPLARGQLLGGMLAGDLLLAAAELDALTLGVEILARATASAALPVRLALLEERRDALVRVLGGLRERELRLQVLERLDEARSC